MIIPLIQVTASSKAQTITLNKQNVSISAVFEEIMMQSDYDFSYSEQQISKVGPITISVTKASITEVLDKCFKGQPLTYSIKGKNIIITAKKTSLFQRLADKFSNIDIQGTIIDETGLPLVGATVKIKGSTTSIRTDHRGRFFMQNVAEDAILVISYVGYQSKEIPASENVGTIKLELATGDLKEIEINAGYYTVKDRERTGSISRVTAKDIGNQPVNNVMGALIGRMSGVNIQQQSGINGGGFSIEIRGRNSLRADGRDPLYLVDGIPYPSSSMNLLTLGVSGISGTGSPLNYISPADIESVEILKDADATSIYGSRGSNGVVLITTKRAKAGKTSLDVNIFRGVSKIGSRFNLMNTAQYQEMRNEAFKNDGITPGQTDYDVNGTWDKNSYSDWQDILIGGTAHNTSIQTGISGGNEQTRFGFRGNYSKQTTVYPGDFSDQKGSGALTINHISNNKKFTADFSLNYTINYNNSPIRDLTSSAVTLAPNAPNIYDENGKLNWALNSSGASTWDNPVAPMFNDYVGKTNTSISNGVMGYQLLPGLKLKSNFGYTNIRLKENVLYRISSANPATAPTGSNDISNNTIETWIIEPQIDYQRKIGNGDLNVLIGSTFQKNNQRSEYVYGFGYTSDLLLGSISAAPIQGGASGVSQYNYNAVFGRINYNWKSRYIINVTGRRDGSSRFGPDKQFANFGAIGAAWIFTKENLIKDSFPFLSFGKLRGSYGITGSDQISDYGYLDTYSPTSRPYQDGSGLIPTRLANPDYSWETNRKLEGSIELGFFKDTFSITTSWYRNRSSNQLVGYSLPDISGFPSIQSNFPATVQNTGWEFEINSTNINTKYFTWKSSFNLSIPTNKLIDYPNIQGSSYANTYRIGESMYSAIAYHYLGVDETTGLYSFEDINGNGLDVTDRIFVTKPLTSHFFGGLNNSIKLKNIQLDFFFQFVDKTLRDPITQFAAAGILANQPQHQLDRWQEIGDNKNFQKFSRNTGTGSAAQRISTYLINSDRLVDASFIRLKNISLSWDAPTSWLQKIKLTNVRLYLQGQNVFTISNYMGDPEVGIVRTLPTLRTVTMGLQLTL